MTTTEIINRIIKVAPVYKTQYSKLYNKYTNGELFELMEQVYAENNVELKLFIIEAIDDMSDYYLSKHPEIEFRYFDTKTQAEEFVFKLTERGKGKFKIEEIII